LTGAITVVGTCMDMCPEFERHEREFQKDVDEWEKVCVVVPAFIISRNG
jgi:hypothetical protein